MDFDEANEKLVALLELKQSRGWAIVEEYLGKRAADLNREAMAPGEPTYHHTAARERVNELAGLIQFLASAEANLKQRCHADDNLDPDAAEQTDS
jgi:hypothetical protein